MPLNHNDPIQPSEGMLIDGAEQCFDSLCADLDSAQVLKHADPLTVTLAANSLLIYAGVVCDLSETPTNGQTVTESSRRRGSQVIKKDQRIEALSRIQRDLLQLLDRLLLPTASRLKLLSDSDATGFDAFL